MDIFPASSSRRPTSPLIRTRPSSRRSHHAQRAISISIDDIHGSLSQVAAGDSVDVYRGVQGAVKLFRPNVKVLAVPTPQGGDLVLGVETKDAADFSYAVDNAQLSFVVRPVVGAKPTARDTATAATVPSDDRAQRINATLTVEVEDSNGVSTAAQEALDLTKSLGGYVVNSNVTTGEEGNATLTVRIPVANVQQAIVELSGLGRIVSQQVADGRLAAGASTPSKDKAVPSAGTDRDCRPPHSE